jgi:two-component system response regulator AtoC
VSVDSSSDRVTELVLHKKCDVVVLDLDCCPADDPFGFLEELRNPETPIVVVAGDGSRKMALELFSRGVQSYCRKPVAIEELSAAVRQAHEHAGLKRELAEYRQQSAPASGCGQLIGSSAGSQLVYDLIRRVADLDAFVLITGESGTGKELIARAIHSLGNREQDRFVAVSSGAIPESLIEAELFGCELGPMPWRS